MGLIDVPVESNYKGRGDGSKMKALAWFGTKDVRLIEAPIPDITQVRTATCFVGVVFLTLPRASPTMSSSRVCA
jgi:hypothetical protein